MCPWLLLTPRPRQSSTFLASAGFRGATRRAQPTASGKPEPIQAGSRIESEDSLQLANVPARYPRRPPGAGPDLHALNLLPLTRLAALGDLSPLRGARWFQEVPPPGEGPDPSRIKPAALTRLAALGDLVSYGGLVRSRSQAPGPPHLRPARLGYARPQKRRSRMKINDTTDCSPSPASRAEGAGSSYRPQPRRGPWFPPPDLRPWVPSPRRKPGRGTG
jgi:hypothetical protein